MPELDPNTIKQILLNSIQGGDVDNNGNLIAKISLKKLLQQFGTDMTFLKITLNSDKINLYISAKVPLEPIKLTNGLTIDLNEYSEDAVVKLPLKKKFIEDFVKLANMPIIGIEEVKIGDTSDVVIKVNTGRKVTPQPTPTGGGIDF
jgi:hypothetical protein